MKYIIGIDVGGTFVKMGLVTDKGRILARQRLATPSAKNCNTTINLIVNEIKNLKKHSGRKITGIGFGAPGFIDNQNGIVHKLVNIPGWQNVPLKRILERLTGIPARIDNDVNCMVLGEATFGIGKGKRNILGITLGTGVGGGLIINNKLYRGSFFTAGEVGHVPVVKDGPKCNCGNRGCLEALVGNKRIVERVVGDIRKGKKTKIIRLAKGSYKRITPEVIQLAAEKGDRYAKRIWEEMGEYIGTVLAGIANVVNPELIIIGGGMAGAGRLFMKTLKDTVKKHTVPVARRGLQIKFSKLGDDAAVLGAAALWLN